MEDLVEILDLKDYNLRSEILLDTGEEKDNLLAQLETDDNKEIFIKSHPVDLIKDEELVTYSTPQKPEPLEAKISPNNPLYFLFLKKEELDLKSKKTLVSTLEYNLLLADKRISEFLVFGSEKPDSFDVFLSGYTKAMDSVILILEEMKTKNDENFYESLLKISDNLKKEEKRIKKYSFGGGVIDQIENVFNNYELKISKLKTKHDFTKSAYKFNLPKEGEYEIYIKDIGVGETEKSLDEGGKWKLIETKYFNQGENNYGFTNPDFGKNLVTDSLKINDFSGDSVYRVSLRYRADGDRSIFSVNQSQEGKLFDFFLPKTGSELTDFEMFFRSSENADRAFVTLSVPEYKDLKIEKIRQPEILLKLKKSGKEIETKIPKITFVKVNPTKYRILVEGAKESYSVVFSESFHKGWKLYFNKAQGNYGETVATYFDGEIKEGTHKMTFLDKATFETWKLKPLAEERHFLVNGYANGWRILPEDTDGQGSYELIAEFEPQRLYYIGLFISLTTLGVCFVVMTVSIIRSKKRNQELN